MQKIEPQVRNCLPIPQKMHRLSTRLRIPEEAERHFPGFLPFTYCTEQQMPQPENRRQRKKIHFMQEENDAVKTQLMVNNQGLITHKTKHKKGHRHDYAIYKKNHPVTPKQVVSVFDLGYLGVEKDEQISSIPNRKMRDQELTQEEKGYNQNHSRKRIVIEHAICRMKKYRIMGDIFRNSLKKHDKL